MPPGCHNRCGECKPCIAVKEPMVPAHGPEDPGYGNAVPVEVSSWSSIAKSYDYKPLGWKFIQENFHVHSIRNNIDELTAALYLQVSLVSQALIFVTRSRSWSFIERPGLMLLSAFLVAQLVATLIAVYANWEFARIQGIGWGWAGVIWLYSIVFYIPLDVLKFMIRYALSGKAWDHMLQNKYIHAKDGAIQRSYVLFPNLKQLYIVSTLMTRDNLPCLISFSQNCPLLEELYIDVAISLLRVLLFVARPRTCALGNIPDSMIYRSVDQYPATHHIPGILILQIEAPIYFANSSYLRERISRWINEEEDQLKSSGETSLQYLILDMSG